MRILITLILKTTTLTVRYELGYHTRTFPPEHGTLLTRNIYELGIVIRWYTVFQTDVAWQHPHMIGAFVIVMPKGNVSYMMSCHFFTLKSDVEKVGKAITFPTHIHLIG